MNPAPYKPSYGFPRPGTDAENDAEMTHGVLEVITCNISGPERTCKILNNTLTMAAAALREGFNPASMSFLITDKIFIFFFFFIFPLLLIVAII